MDHDVLLRAWASYGADISTDDLSLSLVYFK
jgi:hypothetical protein